MIHEVACNNLVSETKCMLDYFFSRESKSFITFKQHYGTTVINKYETFKYSCTRIQNVNHKMVCDVFASACLKAGLGFLKRKKKRQKNPTQQKTDLGFAEGNH